MMNMEVKWIYTRRLAYHHKIPLMISPSWIHQSSLPSDDFIESWDQGLCQPETEDQLWARHQQLWRQSLEETRESFILHHTTHDLESAFGTFKVSVLYAGLYDVEGSGDEEGGRGAGDGGYEVLEPGGTVVVFEFVEILLCGC